MRGLVFTLGFLALFLLFLALALFYAASVEAREAGLVSAARLERTQFAHDNLGTVYRQFLGITGIELEKNATFTQLTLHNRLPSNLTDSTGALPTLEAFLEGTFANQTALSLDVDHSRMAAPFVFFDGLGLNYSMNNTNRTATTLAGNPAVLAYHLRGTLTDRCSTAACSIPSGGWTWVTCSATTIFVRLDITDTTGTSVKVKSKQEGCISPGAVNDFTLNGKNGGSLTVTAGNVSGLSPALRFENVKPLYYLSNLTVNLTASAPTRAWLPVRARVDNTTLPNLVLAER